MKGEVKNILSLLLPLSFNFTLHTPHLKDCVINVEYVRYEHMPWGVSYCEIRLCRHNCRLRGYAVCPEHGDLARVNRDRVAEIRLADIVYFHS